MKLPPLRLLVLDTETTGFVPVTHRVIEYACAIADGGEIVSEYEQLLSIPNNDVPSIVQTLTQITPADLAGKPTFGDIAETIKNMVTPETVIVGQNIPFDLRMLKGEGWDMTAAPWIDTAMLASIVYPELKSYSLGYMSEVLGLTHEPKHRALGDVRATVEMLSLCTERLQSLPTVDLQALQAIAERGPEGYKKFFTSLTAGTSKKRPTWLKLSRHDGPTNDDAKIPATVFPSPSAHSVSVIEESLHPSVLSSVMAGAEKGTVIAVKNLDAVLRRIELPRGITVLPSPDMLLSQTAAKLFLAQKAFTVDEMTLAMKIFLYAPSLKTDLPIHGDEYAVWTAKIAASAESPEYTDRLAHLGNGVALTSHHELLALASSESSSLSQKTPVILDDASMLEDTATAALGWTCLLPTLRAAAAMSEEMTRCSDLVELWTEKVRSGMDLRYLAPSDLQSDDVSGLAERVTTLLKTNIAHAPRRALEDLLRILDPINLAGRITWIECFQDGNKAIKSVPENIADVLRDILYHRAPTTLLVPLGSKTQLASIIPSDITLQDAKLAVLPLAGLHIATPIGISTDQIIASASGKTVLLLGSKRAIEDIFVKHAKTCEDRGLTLLCQGFNGGQSRMQAEFLAAPSPAILVTTAWTYETMELPEGTVNTLIMNTLPFDHPSHAVLSRRAARYASPFADYSLPRLIHRLFRLLRTFRRHSSAGGNVLILDDRLRTKPYGKDVTKYVLSLGEASPVVADTKAQMSLL